MKINYLTIDKAAWDAAKMLDEVLVQCDCGRPPEFKRKVNISRGKTTSCGCMALGAIKHGLSSHPLFNTWAKMMDRCYNKDATGYENYGGRGISVCDRWHSVELFLADVGDRPEGTSLDRVNNDKGYSPDNFRWATKSQQNNNKRLKPKKVKSKLRLPRIKRKQSPKPVPVFIVNTISPPQKLNHKVFYGNLISTLTNQQ